MGARSVMTQRAQIQDNRTTNDDHGHPGPPIWVTRAEEMPCRIFNTGDRINYGTGIYTTNTLTMLVPLASEITIDNRVLSVIDRRGEELHGKMTIESIVRREDHLAVRLKKIA